MRARMQEFAKYVEGGSRWMERVTLVKDNEVGFVVRDAKERNPDGGTAKVSVNQWCGWQKLREGWESSGLGGRWSQELVRAQCAGAAKRLHCQHPLNHQQKPPAPPPNTTDLASPANSAHWDEPLLKFQ